MHHILDDLNVAQRAAVTSESDILQVLAPPGSGKTKTLTSKVAYLLEHHGYRPWNIICLTFTIKSSREMRERIAKLLGNGVESKLILGTFHSICRRYLVSYGHLIGIRKGFGIADSSDSISIIKRIVKRCRLNVDPQKARARISHTKSKGLHWGDLAQDLGKKQNTEQYDFITVFEEYERQLSASNLLDYDDLLLRCVDLLQKHPSCVSNVEAVLIDEFQDTNVTQFELMTLFAHQHKRITTVGDMDQSIYGWRSAEVKNLKRMQKEYPDTLIIHLQENYRSAAAILLAAGEVIEQDESRPQVCMLPTHCPGTAPVLRRLPSAGVEAAWLVNELQRTRALAGNMFTYSDYAILLRSASLSRMIETALGKAGIPYRMVGGHRFYDRVEIKLLLDYLRVVSQPTNNDAIVRCINVPARRIGDATVKGLLEEAELNRSSLWELLLNIVNGSKPQTKITHAAESGIGNFVGLIRSRKNQMTDSSKTCSPEQLLRQIIKRLDLQAWLKKTYAEDHEARWTNVEELVAQAADYQLIRRSGNEKDSELLDEDMLPQINGLEQQSNNTSEETLSKFLANVALATELQREEGAEDGTSPQHQVTISTIHAAKGLEWPIVFVPSAYDGCIPHSRAEDNDEERRLLYVAMTRAQALLYLSCPTKNSQREAATLSPFLSGSKVQHLLSSQGPALGSVEVSDVARILGRDCPSQTAVAESCKDLVDYEDNKWPLDGSKSIEMIQSRWSKFDNEGAEGAMKRQPKRRKVDHDAVPISSDTPQTASVGSATTMQLSSNFSYNSVGFTTASAQMQSMNEITAFEKTKEAVNIEQPKKLKTEKVVTDQGSLLSLWGIKRPHEETSRPANLQHETSLQRLSESNALPQLPKPLSSYHIPSQATSTRPLRVIDENTNSSNGYVFLSSSPPVEHTCKHARSNDIQDTALVCKENEVPESQMTETLKETKMPRKTLGMRRSLAGWNAGGKPGFSVPRVQR
ncbi:uncharacterized protein KY384_001834 [Bacidia gigantensis]|uniref:uncharacterized protein n=1 Tax=Bacidia gigantensis TaxID=2732470 RepID=UPI001D0402D4|nr:uncharacterized protein KY384_001834 [Bacidia gigantensis]KAG8533051.1 hypothetical protein KY384_001834 [Bacidia gigantensis]